MNKRSLVSLSLLPALLSGSNGLAASGTGSNKFLDFLGNHGVFVGQAAGGAGSGTHKAFLSFSTGLLGEVYRSGPSSVSLGVLGTLPAKSGGLLYGSSLKLVGGLRMAALEAMVSPGVQFLDAADGRYRIESEISGRLPQAGWFRAISLMIRPGAIVRSLREKDAIDESGVVLNAQFFKGFIREMTGIENLSLQGSLGFSKNLFVKDATKAWYEKGIAGQVGFVLGASKQKTRLLENLSNYLLREKEKLAATAAPAGQQGQTGTGAAAVQNGSQVANSVSGPQSQAGTAASAAQAAVVPIEEKEVTKLYELMERVAVDLKCLHQGVLAAQEWEALEAKVLDFVKAQLKTDDDSLKTFLGATDLEATGSKARILTVLDSLMNNKSDYSKELTGCKEADEVERKKAELNRIVKTFEAAEKLIDQTFESSVQLIIKALENSTLARKGEKAETLKAELLKALQTNLKKVSGDQINLKQFDKTEKFVVNKLAALLDKKAEKHQDEIIQRGLKGLAKGFKQTVQKLSTNLKNSADNAEKLLGPVVEGAFRLLAVQHLLENCDIRNVDNLLGLVTENDKFDSFWKELRKFVFDASVFEQPKLNDFGRKLENIEGIDGYKEVDHVIVLGIALKELQGNKEDDAKDNLLKSLQDLKGFRDEAVDLFKRVPQSLKDGLKHLDVSDAGLTSDLSGCLQLFKEGCNQLRKLVRGTNDASELVKIVNASTPAASIETNYSKAAAIYEELGREVKELKGKLGVNYLISSQNSSDSLKTKLIPSDILGVEALFEAQAKSFKEIALEATEKTKRKSDEAVAPGGSLVAKEEAAENQAKVYDTEATKLKKEIEDLKERIQDGSKIEKSLKEAKDQLDGVLSLNNLFVTRQRLEEALKFNQSEVAQVQRDVQGIVEALKGVTDQLCTYLQEPDSKEDRQAWLELLGLFSRVTDYTGSFNTPMGGVLYQYLTTPRLKEGETEDAEVHIEGVFSMPCALGKDVTGLGDLDAILRTLTQLDQRNGACWSCAAIAERVVSIAKSRKFTTYTQDAKGRVKSQTYELPENLSLKQLVPDEHKAEQTKLTKALELLMGCVKRSGLWEGDVLRANIQTLRADREKIIYDLFKFCLEAGKALNGQEVTLDDVDELNYKLSNGDLDALNACQSKQADLEDLGFFQSGSNSSRAKLTELEALLGWPSMYPVGEKSHLFSDSSTFKQALKAIGTAHFSDIYEELADKPLSSALYEMVIGKGPSLMAASIAARQSELNAREQEKKDIESNIREKEAAQLKAELGKQAEKANVDQCKQEIDAFKGYSVKLEKAITNIESGELSPISLA